jgi:CBS domain-containing protein
VRLLRRKIGSVADGGAATAGEVEREPVEGGAQMRVDQIMTNDVATVSPETRLRDVARLLSERRISGVPVCDADGRVVGVVSEADVLAKEEGLPLDERSPLAWLVGRSRDRSKATATTAGEAMTAPALTIAPWRSVAAAARTMSEHEVNRLPVVKSEKLIGIVTRADLVRAFTRSDDEIRREIEQDVLLGALWIDPDRVQIDVQDGVVELRGELETRIDAELVEGYVRRVPGVVDVGARLSWRSERPKRLGETRLSVYF